MDTNSITKTVGEIGSTQMGYVDLTEGHNGFGGGGRGSMKASGSGGGGTHLLADAKMGKAPAPKKPGTPAGEQGTSAEQPAGPQEPEAGPQTPPEAGPQTPPEYPTGGNDTSSTPGGGLGWPAESTSRMGNFRSGLTSSRPSGLGWPAESLGEGA
jgi:hypothetical protein